MSIKNPPSIGTIRQFVRAIAAGGGTCEGMDYYWWETGNCEVYSDRDDIDPKADDVCAYVGSTAWRADAGGLSAIDAAVMAYRRVAEQQAQQEAQS